MFPMKDIFLLCIFRVDFFQLAFRKCAINMVQYFCFCIVVNFLGQRPGISHVLIISRKKVLTLGISFDWQIPQEEPTEFA